MKTEQRTLPSGRGKPFRQSLAFSVGFIAFVSALDLGWVGFSAVVLGGGAADASGAVFVLIAIAAIGVIAGVVVMAAMLLRARAAIVGDQVRVRAVADARRTVTGFGIAMVVVGLVVLAVGYALSAGAVGALSAGALFVVAIFSFFSRFVLRGVMKALS